MSDWNTVGQRLNSLAGRFDDFEFVVNGMPLSPEQIAQFQRATGLAVLEPGRFWFDPGTGAMGREGSPWPLYHLHGTQGAIAGQRSLSQRRMLFSEADLTGGWRIGDDFLPR